jgi:hypothetical protein
MLQTGSSWRSNRMPPRPARFYRRIRDFRYQLTSIGAFMPVYIAEKIAHGRFRIAGGAPGKEVSWQVTGVRQDPFARAHPLQVEEEKNEEVRGFYQHPELYGAPEELGIDYRNRPKQLELAPASLAAEEGPAPPPPRPPESLELRTPPEPSRALPEPPVMRTPPVPHPASAPRAMPEPPAAPREISAPAAVPSAPPEAKQPPAKVQSPVKQKPEERK